MQHAKFRKKTSILNFPYNIGICPTLVQIPTFDNLCTPPSPPFLSYLMIVTVLTTEILTQAKKLPFAFILWIVELPSGACSTAWKFPTLMTDDTPHSSGGGGALTQSNTGVQ